MPDPDLQREALEKWGIEAQATKLIEEAGELTAALAGWFLGTVTAEEVYEELVGVRSTLDSVDLWFDRKILWTERKRIVAEQEQKLREALDDA